MIGHVPVGRTESSRKNWIKVQKDMIISCGQDQVDREGKIKLTRQDQERMHI